MTKYGLYPSDISRKTQDSYCLCESKFSIRGKTVRGLFFGVFDGHGVFGAECSTFCKDFVCVCLPRYY